MIKYLFSDVDGTLIKGKHGKINKDTIKKIKNFIKSGNKFYMATGRTDEDIKFLEKKLGITCDYRISQNGTLLKDKNNQTLFSCNIDENVLLSLKNYLYNLKNIRIEVSAGAIKYVDSKRPTVYPSEMVANIIIEEKLQEKIGTEILPSIFLILQEFEESFDEIKNYINTNYKDSLVAVKTSHGILEIINKNSSKGNAIKHILEKENINKNDVFVVGDNDNDVSMFELLPERSFVIKEAKYAVSKHAKFMVNFVGDVIDYINNPITSYNRTNKTLISLENSLIISYAKSNLNLTKDSSATLNYLVSSSKQAGACSIITDNLHHLKELNSLGDLIKIFCMEYSNSNALAEVITNLKIKNITINAISIYFNVNNQTYNYLNLENTIKVIKESHPEIILIAEIENAESIKIANNLNFNLIYLKDTTSNNNVIANTLNSNIQKLLKAAIKDSNIPLIAHCYTNNPKDIQNVLKLKAHGVVISVNEILPNTIIQNITSNIPTKTYKGIDVL